MNPFELSSAPLETLIRDFAELRPVPYDKNTVDPYSKTRVILMNGTEFEQCWFSHQFSRHETNNDLRRELALLRRLEQQQQKLVSCLKPENETVLEHTIGYEQLAVDLTAGMAARETNRMVKQALDFALLEDFDHLYRYANLLDTRAGLKAEDLVGHYTEIMPGRPTISEHRHPFDDIRNTISKTNDSLLTRLQVNIITAAEQQTMNFYMNNACTDPDEAGRALYQEIGMIEEQHVTHYGSLLDPTATWLECLLMHQYTECYLYWSCHETECEPHLKNTWARLFEEEVSHLHKAARLLKQYENKDWQQVIPDGTFPEALSLHENIDYVRGVLAASATLTSAREGYVPVDDVPPDACFFTWQRAVAADSEQVPSHRVIARHIAQSGTDYRWETALNPMPPLQNRTQDNTSLGREPAKIYAMS